MMIDVSLLPDVKRQQRLIRWSSYLAKTVFVISVLVLLGWQFSIDFLKRPLHGLSAMNPSTALCLAFVGIAFLLFRARYPSRQNTAIAYFLSIVVVVTGLMRLADIFLGFNIPVDTLLFSKQLAADIIAGTSNRMAPNSAAGLVFAGICLLLINTRNQSKRWIINVIALLVALLALLSIIGYIYRVRAFYGIFSYVPMAIHTAFCFLLIALAIIFAFPGEGVMKEFTSIYAGSLTSRVMIPLVIIIPVVLGFLRVYGHWKNLFSIEFGVTILVVSIIVVFTGIIWYDATLLNRRDALRKITEDTLRESEQKYRLLVNNVKDYAIFMIDPSGCILSWNEGAEGIKGYKANEITGKHISIFYTKEEVDRNEPARNLAIAEEKGRYESEGWRVRKDGVIFWANIVITALYDHENRLQGFTKITRDITHKKKAEEKFRNLLEAAPDAMVIANEEGRIVLVNRQTESLFGYTRAELIDQPVEILIPADRRNRHKQHRAGYMANPKVRSMGTGLELFAVRKDGTQFPVEISLSPLATEEGDLILSSVRDITDRKKAEEKFRGLLESAPDAMVIANEEGKITLINQQTENLFGYTRDELIGQPVEILIPASLKEKHIGHRAHYAANPKRRSMGSGLELFATRKNGTEFPVEISLAPLTTEEGTLVSASIRDITERKKTEEKVTYMARLMEDTNDAVFSTDSSTILKTWNRAAELQYGYTSAEAIGRPANDILKTQITSAESAALRQKIIKQGYWRGELVQLKKDGAPVTVLTSVSVTHNAKGEIDGFVSICRDITERKNLEDQLKKFNEELEEQVRQKTSELTGIFERITDAFIALDKDFHYTYLNKKAGELIHHEPQSLIGKRVWDVFPDVVDSSTYNAFTKAMAEQTYIVNEDYYPPLNLWQENHIYPSPDGLSVFIRDISERKKSEEALKYSEETRRLIMNSSLDAIVCIDMSGNVITWNPQAEKIFGWTFEDIKGQPLTNTIIPPRYRDQHLMGMKRYTETGYGPLLNKAIELTAMNRNGKEFPIEMSIVSIHQDAEELFCAFIRDITERKKNEEAIKASEKKYKLLFESNPMPMWMLSLPNLNIIDVNESAISHYGYSREEFLTMNARQLRPAEDLEKFEQHSRGLSTGTRLAGIWRHRKKNGAIILVDVIAHDVVYEGHTVRLILSNDITEKVKAEEDLKQSYENIRELASRLQDIREEERAAMAREVHDELGQQITGLKMDVSWIAKKMTNESEAVRQKIKGILDLLDVTVKTVRKIATELRPSILDDLGLTEAMQWQSLEFEKRSGIQTSFSSTLNQANIPGDIAIALFRIYQESLTNVARHAQATLVRSAFWQTNNELRLEITDNGKGFDMSKNSRKKTLGLLGMRERTLMIGGRYEINSQPGKGTTVLVTIPWIEKPHSEQ